MNRVKWLFCTATIVLIMGMLVTGCNTNSYDTDENSQALELRSYEVPAEYASEVSSVIRDLLSQVGKDRAQIGKARIGPGGVVTVTAPASVHSGIEKMIADIIKAKPEPPPVVSLTYWIVVGRGYARRGLGKRLLECMESWAAQDGIRRIYVETSSSPPYEAARAFYEKHGYLLACVLEDFYRKGDHKMTFMKETGHGAR